MSALPRIPIRVESAPPDPGFGTIGGGVEAVLVEIATLLDRVAAGGEPGAIDLRSLPISPSEHLQLADALGQGELTITLEAEGRSTLRETGIRGVWWNEYRDPNDEVVAVFIEVAKVPAIVPAEPGDLQSGAHALRANIKRRRDT